MMQAVVFRDRTHPPASTAVTASPLTVSLKAASIAAMGRVSPRVLGACQSFLKLPPRLLFLFCVVEMHRVSV